MRRVHHRAAADAVEVHDLDRRVVVVDRIVLGPGADVGTGGIVAEEARLPVAAGAGIRRGVHPAALFQAEDVHPCVREAPGHRRAGGAGADDQHIHGIVHAGLFLTWRGMPRSALEMRCAAVRFVMAVKAWSIHSPTQGYDLARCLYAPWWRFEPPKMAMLADDRPIFSRLGMAASAATHPALPTTSPIASESRRNIRPPAPATRHRCGPGPDEG